ncbi:MAG: hypothetical protein ACREKE_08720 [bacterium]
MVFPRNTDYKEAFLARWGLAVGLGLLLLGLAARSRAADFDISPQAGSTPVPGVLSQSQINAIPGGSTVNAIDRDWSEARLRVEPGLWTDDVPVWLQAGDLPTADNLTPNGFRADARLYPGGGVLGQLYYAPWSRLLLGLSGNLPGAVGSGPLSLDRDDGQGLARIILLREHRFFPALAVGWDGSNYADVASKGLYAVASKEVHADPVFLQVHLGADSGPQVRSFYGRRDLRGFGAVTASWRCLGVFSSLDEALDPGGPRWCAGLEASAGPVTVGLEFQDLGGLRTDTPASRLLRLSWNGSF